MGMSGEAVIRRRHESSDRVGVAEPGVVPPRVVVGALGVLVGVGIRVVVRRDDKVANREEVASSPIHVRSHVSIDW